jgi:endonuclease/exonuclease/phosphatase family metal-dependent hydrolase
MKLATAKRSAQAEIMHDDILKYGGKRSSAATSMMRLFLYTYQTIISGLQDAFVQKGSGFGKSFATKLGIFRIDYVLPDTSIQVNSCRTIRRELSDHYPVVVTMSL